MSDQPIFVIGVPRSGTTLLRVMLDSHPNIASGPETPWFCAHHPRTVGSLVDYLIEDQHGYCKNFGGSRAEVFDAARNFVSSLLGAYAARRGKSRWAEKTPDNLRFLPFLTELFPRAHFIHIRRHPLDVALSTSTVPPHRKGVTPLNERSLTLFYNQPIANNPFSALLRWVHWESLIARGLANTERLPLQYEELVREPERIMRGVLEFAGEPWSPATLEFTAQPHEFPSWEWGSADVVHYSAAANGVTTARSGRAERELSAVDRQILDSLLPPASDSTIAPSGRLGEATEASSELYTRLVEWVNQIAESVGFRSLPPGPERWSFPWLWFNALSRQNWPGKRVIVTGHEDGPLPWILAMLGAKVTIATPRAECLPLWERLRDGLSVSIEWGTPPEPADVVVSDYALDRETDKQAAVAAGLRLLKPGGWLAIAFGVGEPEMHFPPWFGTPATIAEAERIAGPLNREDVQGFRYWNMRSQEHGDYTVCAAVLRNASDS